MLAMGTPGKGDGGQVAGARGTGNGGQIATLTIATSGEGDGRQVVGGFLVQMLLLVCRQNSGQIFLPDAACRSQITSRWNRLPHPSNAH